MKVFEFDSIPESYPELLKYVVEHGEEVSPRGMLTKEITPATVVINNPKKRIIDDPIRKNNYGFMIGELIWILKGTNDLSISHYNKQWNNYSDDGKTLNGAYGKRIFNWNNNTINQFKSVYSKLKKDNDSRQGTIIIFDPATDFKDTKDVPCTNLMRFSIRNNKLNMMVMMRSNDLIFGYPYDVYNFTMLQEIMAGMLNVEVGKYTHVVDSLHLYEMHFELAENIINSNHTHIYNTFEPLDARLEVENLNSTLKTIFDIEETTRLLPGLVDIESIIKNINTIENEYWKSICAFNAFYNYKKAKIKSEELNMLKKLISNELQFLI